MATTVTSSGTTTTLPFSSPAALAVAGPATATAGLTPGGVSQTVQNQTTPVGKAYNYTLVVQIPIPWLSVNIGDLVAAFVLPALTALGIPQAIEWLSANVVGIIQNVANDTMKLIKAIPEATVTILVKVGPVVVLNIVLVAQKVPVVIPIPTFQLGLPNFVFDAFFNFSLPFPVPPPTYIYVPIPVPVIAFNGNLLTISGGSIFAGAGGSAGVAPYTVGNPIYLPQI